MNSSSPSLGIIAGFGPDTSAEFCARLVRHAHAHKPGHPPAFVVDFVSAPPQLAESAINGSREAGMSLVETLNQSIRRLQSTGVRTIAFPCNTMHVFADRFAVSPSRFLHIVDAVSDVLKQSDTRKVGLLATQLTVSSGLYTQRLRQSGIDCLVPSSDLQQQLSECIAHFVRTGTVLPRTAHTFADIFEEFRMQDIATIVLGCTDLSGMLERCHCVSSMRCVDSMDVLAQACARVCV